MEEKLPITEDLIFMRYQHQSGGSSDSEEEQKSEVQDIVGLVFFYPSMNFTRVIEVELKNATALRECDDLIEYVCKLLYISNEDKHIRETSKNPQAMAAQRKRIMRYCLETDLDVLL